MKTKDKHFISELDRFLAEFDQGLVAYSDSQLKEISKHQRVAKLRDGVQPDSTTDDIWEKF